MRVSDDSFADYRELRKQQFGFEQIPLPTSLQLSEADLELNRRGKIKVLVFSNHRRRVSKEKQANFCSSTMALPCTVRWPMPKRTPGEPKSLKTWPKPKSAMPRAGRGC